LNAFLDRLLTTLKDKLALLRKRSAEEKEYAALVNEAVERVVDQVNPRLRAVGGYRKRLYPVVERGLAYTRELAARVPGPVTVDRRSWASDPYVNALFGNVERIRWVVTGPEVRKYVQENPGGGDCYALLAATPEVRNQLGMELAGEQVQRDVRQVTVSFSDHEVGLVAAAEQEVRAALAHLGLEVMVTIAVEDITGREARIGELEERLRVVRLKRKVADAGSRGAALVLGGGASRAQDVGELDARIAELERELAEAKRGYAGLEDHLARLVEVLERPEVHLGLDAVKVRLDRMNIVRVGGDDAATHEIAFTRVRRGDTQARVVTLIRFPRSEMLSDQERLRGVESYLS
jgi:hypothetical protein